MRRHSITLDQIFCRVRGRANCSFLIHGGSVGVGRGMSVSIGGGDIRRILRVLFMKGGVHCGIRKRRVSICGPRRSERGTVAKLIVSITGRPIVNTSIIMVKSAGKYVASFSKGFSLRISRFPIGLRVDCVNCGSRRMAMHSAGAVRIMLHRSARALSRIIMIKCNSRGGTGLAKTITSIGVSRIVNGHPLSRTTSTLRNAIPNLFISDSNGTPNGDGSFRVHNTCSMNVGGSSNSCNDTVGPLVLVSGIRKSLSVIGPRSVRAIAILGSTTSTTVCNTHTTNNMVLIAAGHPGKRASFRLGCGGGFTFTATVGLPRRTPLVRCLRTCSSTTKSRF